MMQSQVGSVAVSQAGTNDVGPFYVAPASTVVRLYIRNDGPAVLLLAYESSSINGASAFSGSSGRFTLPADRDVVFILTPRQGVYAVSQGIGASLSYHASEALPFDAR